MGPPLVPGTGLVMLLDSQTWERGPITSGGEGGGRFRKVVEVGEEERDKNHQQLS